VGSLRGGTARAKRRQMAMAGVRAVVTVLALVGAEQTAWASCGKDLDCSGEQICEAGACVDPHPSEPRAVGPARVIRVEAPPAPVVPRYEQRSVPLVLLGTAAMGAGVVGLAIGLFSSERQCYRDLGEGFREEHCKWSHNYAAYAVGGLLLVGGIPLVIVGSKRVPVRQEARLSVLAAPHAAGLKLELTL